MAKEMNHLPSFSSQLDLLESEGRHTEMSNDILRMMMKNVDLSPLAGKIIKFLAVPYPPCKKVLYSFLTRYSSGIADLNVLATNSLLKDFQDPNPFVRRLVIRTVCSIPCLADLSQQLLPRALCDPSGYVRCAAASASTLLRRDPRDDEDLINTLYEMIRDPDPSVVCSSLRALDDILAEEGGVAVNAKIAHYLLRRIGDFRGWDFAVVHGVLEKYSPKSGQEVVFVLNALDTKLLDRDPEVFLLAADLALRYASGRGLSGDVIAQIAPQLKRLLDCSSAEVLSSLLEAVEAYLPEHGEVFAAFHKSFFCRFSDTTPVKVQKLRIVVSLVGEVNASSIAGEVLAHCCDASREVSGQAIRSFTDLTRRRPELCLSTFVQLMDIQFNGVSEGVLNALSAVDLGRSPDDVRGCVLSAVARYSQAGSATRNAESKLALLRFVGSYGRDIPSAPYILECFANEEEEGSRGNERMVSFLLTTCVKLFLIRPEEMQVVLGRVLQEAGKSRSLLVQKQAAVYYRLLKELDIAMKDAPVDCTDGLWPLKILTA